MSASTASPHQTRLPGDERLRVVERRELRPERNDQVVVRGIDLAIVDVDPQHLHRGLVLREPLGDVAGRRRLLVLEDEGAQSPASRRRSSGASHRCGRDRLGAGEFRLHVGRDAAHDVGEPGHHLAELVVRRGERRSEQRLVAGVAVAGRLGRQDDQVAIERRRVDPRRRRRSSGGRNDSPSRGSTNETPSRYPWPRTSRTSGIAVERAPQLVEELGTAIVHALDQPLGPHRLENGEPDGARERRAVPRVAEGEAARALGERLVHVLADENGADRRVARAEPLRRRDDVGRRRPSPRPRTSDRSGRPP